MDGLFETIKLPRELVKCFNSHLGLRMKNDGNQSQATKLSLKNCKTQRNNISPFSNAFVLLGEEIPSLRTNWVLLWQFWISVEWVSFSVVLTLPYHEAFLSLKIVSRVPLVQNLLKEAGGAKRVAKCPGWEYYGAAKWAFGDGFIL